MLDIKFIRENPEKVKTACKNRGSKVDISELLEIDKQKREALAALEDMQAKKNKASDLISKTKNPKEKQKIILEMQELDKNSDRLNKKLKESEVEFNSLIFQLPNIPLGNVPVGKDEKDNKVIKEFGGKTIFGFKPKDYMAIAENLDLIDAERAAKVSGSRFVYLKREAVLLEFALVNFAFEFLVKKGFIPILPPIMMKEEMAKGLGHLEQTDKEEAYYIEKDKLFLAGTAEQPIGAMHADEILKETDLPRRYVGFSTCFRREAGSYGKDTKGGFRDHQFDKVEMFSFCLPEKSQEEHKLFLEIEKEMMDALKIPYRVVQLCTGDLSLPSASTYDIESWFPFENRYRETHSASNCTDFQARRLNIRYKNRDGKLNFVHMINGTAFSRRPLLAILESCQQKDGSVKIPETLHKYTGFKEIKRNG